MNSKLIAAATAFAALAAGASSAYACPNGYKSVWIQGNHVCMLDASASNKLAAPGVGGTSAKIQKLKRR